MKSFVRAVFILSALSVGGLASAANWNNSSGSRSANYIQEQATAFEKFNPTAGPLSPKLTSTDIDQQLQSEHHSLNKLDVGYPLTLSRRANADHWRAMSGFPGDEQSTIIRIELPPDHCGDLDCKSKNGAGRFEFTYKKDSTAPWLGGKTKGSWEVYIPSDFDDPDGIARHHLGQIHGPHDGPLYILTIAGAGYINNPEVEPGDLVIETRGVLSPTGSPYDLSQAFRYQYLVAKKGAFRGKWHHIYYDATWHTDPKLGHIKFIANGNTIIDSNGATVSPDITVAPQGKEVNSPRDAFERDAGLDFQFGIYTWKRKAFKAHYGRNLRPLVVYYRNVRVANDYSEELDRKKYKVKYFDDTLAALNNFELVDSVPTNFPRYRVKPVPEINVDYLQTFPPTTEGERTEYHSSSDVDRYFLDIIFKKLVVVDQQSGERYNFKLDAQIKGYGYTTVLRVRNKSEFPKEVGEVHFKLAEKCRFEEAIEQWESFRALVVPVYTAEKKWIPVYSCYVNAIIEGHALADGPTKTAYVYLATLFRVDQLLEVFLAKDTYEKIINSVQFSSLSTVNFVPKTQDETLLKNRNPSLYARQQEIRLKLAEKNQARKAITDSIRREQELFNNGLVQLGIEKQAGNRYRVINESRFKRGEYQFLKVERPSDENKPLKIRFKYFEPAEDRVGGSMFKGGITIFTLGEDAGSYVYAGVKMNPKIFKNNSISRTDWDDLMTLCAYDFANDYFEIPLYDPAGELKQTESFDCAVRTIADPKIMSFISLLVFVGNHVDWKKHIP